MKMYHPTIFGTARLKLLLIGAAIASLGLGSCTKYINLEPEDATYDQVFWTSGENVEKAISGAYGQIRNAFQQDRSYFVFGDLPADEFWLDAGTFWNYQDLLYQRRFRFSYAPYLEQTVHNWTRFYTIVNQTHLIVENTARIGVDEFDGGWEEKNRLLGEGHFLRAFTYFYINKVWGDPILTKESLKDPTKVEPIGRSPEAAVLDYCIEDLKKASALLPFNAETGLDKSRADKGAAWALLAQVYAWKQDYANAEKYCDSVIQSNQYALEAGENFSAIFQGNSNETILELFMKFDANNKEATADFFGDFLHDPIVRNKAPWEAWELNGDRIYTLYDSTVDKRFHQTVGLIETGYPALVKYANVNYFDPSRPTVYVVDNNLVLIRLADILLLKAEAAFKNGNEGVALQYLNQVKERAGLEPVALTGEALYYELIDERYRELYGEGVLAFDMIRMGKLAELFPDAYSAERISKKGYYWPLDMRTLLPQDPLLTQNEWWKNH
ncbi:RagB/SusD family nutrient uptake outer membrane protein [Flavihumibacter rivuli]|uniref:RagB/SusD family nutrient uptake outer membrane protein n=1 Tax=Flavihumibacter rivuli TaxID=2838156 RepID=UPI001BDE01C6|nr:RagB/SusD family nutrient uptake outer membrane protein [Flavihumibacter rivuli]ULQ55502.1 RagB/SusD family nutrient uptake outer membrane protein [Flavihumibacter rivuli]